MDCSGLTTGDHEPLISGIPLELLVSIFSHLDIHHQARTRRVCRTWSDAVGVCWPLEQVEINCQLKHDYHMWKGTNELDSEEAKLDTMLQVALSGRTKTLILCDIVLSHRRIMLLLVNRLKERTPKLPILCFKRSSAVVELALYPWVRPVEMRNYASDNHGNLLLFIHHQPCEKVILWNYTIKDIMHYDILFNPNFRFIEGMLRKAGSEGVISRLVVDCGWSNIQVFRSLLSALSADWPSVDEDVRENVAIVYQHWMQNDEYPDSWAVRLVNLFTYHCTDPYKQRPKNYEDRNNLNVAQLNDMTVAFLALFFAVYEANY